MLPPQWWSGDSTEARIIGVIAVQTKVLSFVKRSHDGPTIRLSSCDHDHQQ